MDEEALSKPSRRDGGLNLPSVLVLLWMFRRFRGRDPDRPQITSLNPRSKAVLERAKELAGEGREDAQAVAELGALASGRRRTLRQAEKASRFAGYHRELRVPNLTNRLLKAAVARERTPRAPTAADDERIAAIETFKELAKDEQWAFLVQAQPSLDKLEADVRTGRFGERTAPPGELRRGTRTRVTVDGRPMEKVTLSSSDPPYTPEETRLLRELARGRMHLTSELESLIGPRSGQTDPVLASQQALDAAERHLTRPPSRETGSAEVPLT